MACLWCVSEPVPASAVPITYSYTGTVNNILDSDSVTGVQIGDAFQFTFTFDNALNTDSNPRSDVADYGALLSASTKFTRSSADVYTAAPALSAPYTLEVANDHPISTVRTVDAFAVSTQSFIEIGSGEFVYTIMYISMETQNLSLFSSTDLSMLGPLTPAPGLFEYGHSFDFIQDFLPSSEYVEIDGVVTGVGQAAVPEPTTMFLLAAGLIGLTGYGRKRLLKK